MTVITNTILTIHYKIYRLNFHMMNYGHAGQEPNMYKGFKKFKSIPTSFNKSRKTTKNITSFKENARIKNIESNKLTN